MSAALPAQPHAAPALAATGRWLREQGYHFVTVTPATQARVLAREPGAPARDLRDVFGWNRPFAPALLPPELLAALRAEEWLEPAGRDGWLRSRVRFSSLGGELFAHSAYPTTQADAVFFGPDTCRFADLIEGELQRAALRPGARILDVGCGSGAGGLLAAKWSAPARPQLVLADINAAALRIARVNTELAGLQQVRFAQGDLFGCVEGAFDLIVANPPYLNDGQARAYRDGGGARGEGLSQRIVGEGLSCLAPGGRLVLYTGVAIVAGRDPLREAVEPQLQARGWPWHWRELDPDVFGEELEQPGYADCERIAAVALVVQRPAEVPAAA